MALIAQRTRRVAQRIPSPARIVPGAAAAFAAWPAPAAGRVRGLPPYGRAAAGLFVAGGVVAAALLLHAAGPAGHVAARPAPAAQTAVGPYLPGPLPALPNGFAAQQPTSVPRLTGLLAADLFQAANDASRAASAAGVFGPPAPAAAAPAGPTLDDLLQAQAQVAQTQLVLLGLQQGATDTQIQAAQQQVAAAKQQITAAQATSAATASATPTATAAATPVATPAPQAAPTDAPAPSPAATDTAPTADATAAPAYSADDIAAAQAAVAQAQQALDQATAYNASLAAAPLAATTAQSATSAAAEGSSSSAAAPQTAAAGSTPGVAADATPAAGPVILGARPPVPLSSDARSVAAMRPPAVQPTAQPAAAPVAQATPAPQPLDLAPYQAALELAQQNLAVMSAPPPAADSTTPQDSAAVAAATPARAVAPLLAPADTATPAPSASPAPTPLPSSTVAAAGDGTAAAALGTDGDTETTSPESRYAGAVAQLQALTAKPSPDTVQAAQSAYDLATQRFNALMQQAAPDVRSQINPDPLTALQHYHPDGAALAPNGFAWPAHGPITQGFGMTPFAAAGAYGGAGHPGIDIGQSPGLPVTAAADGTVSFSGGDPTTGYGYYVDILHANGYMTRYGHLMTPSFLKAGDHVTQGQLIGLSGSTGDSTGPHVHFEVRLNGVPIDPLPALSGVLPKPLVP